MVVMNLWRDCLSPRRRASRPSELFQDAALAGAWRQRSASAASRRATAPRERRRRCATAVNDCRAPQSAHIILMPVLGKSFMPRRD